MTQSTMTRWIEIADERHFWEDAAVNPIPEAGEHHFLHLGETILRATAKASSCALACGRSVSQFKKNRVSVKAQLHDQSNREPALSDLLHDPIAQALMTADHVDLQEMDAVLNAAREALSQRPI